MNDRNVAPGDFFHGSITVLFKLSFVVAVNNARVLYVATEKGSLRLRSVKRTDFEDWAKRFGVKLNEPFCSR